MAVLFVSHSGKDDGLATQLASWLNANGFADIFVDHDSIAGGDKWAKALQTSAGACRVVLFLVTENWLSSSECFGEFKAAWYMGKRLVPLIAVSPDALSSEQSRLRFSQVCGEDQGVDLRRCRTAPGGLDIDADSGAATLLRASLRAAGAMSQVGLDPEAFDIDNKLRPTPFPGLSSFGDSDADAALFYGRDREIAKTLEELRKVRAEGDQRPFVILGASGAGKSSLLKAGIIPRLRREIPAWIPLHAFRPGADPLLNFAEAVAQTLAGYGVREASGVIRDRLLKAWHGAPREADGSLAAEGLRAISNALGEEGAQLRRAVGQSQASILISVDQAEELARSEGVSAEVLTDYLRAALKTSQSPWQLAFAIRTDNFPELQATKRFQDLEARVFDLRALSVFRFDSVVEQPAKRYGVSVEPDLVYALMEDAPNEDALPLLAFALERLWTQYAASGSLTRAQYDKVGGLQGLIEDAAERAMRGIEPGDDAPFPPGPPPPRLIALAASVFVPALAEINEKGATVRHIAQWSSFNEEQQDLLSRFDRWRLVVRRGEASSNTVEVAHEALFRTWRRLETWLEPERQRLDALRALQADSANWERRGREDLYLNHRSVRLTEARELLEIPGYRARLSQTGFDYIAQCEIAEKRNDDLQTLAKLKQDYKQIRFPAFAFLVASGFFVLFTVMLYHFRYMLYSNIYFLAMYAFVFIVVAKIIANYFFSMRQTVAKLRQIVRLEIEAGLHNEAYDHLFPKPWLRVLPRRPIFHSLLRGGMEGKLLKAHALMFADKAAKAKAIYLRYSGMRLRKDAGLWDFAVTSAFDRFERRGMHAQLMDAMRAQLTGSAAAQRSAKLRLWRARAAYIAGAVILVTAGLVWSRIGSEWMRHQELDYWQTVMAPAVLDAKEESTLAAQPGQTFKECKNGCPEMVVIPAGEFLMGSPDNEEGRNKDRESPQHRVTVPKPFAIGKYPVTFAQWDICADQGACAQWMPANDQGWGRENRPVVRVNWRDANAYAAWLSRVTGKRYRLPSEAEWEYAARAGTTGAYSWGPTIGINNANCDGCGSQWDNKQTAPAGSFKPNAFGLYDMTGNIYQWCEDSWHDNYNGKPDALKASGGAWLAEIGDMRIIRGGSWGASPNNIRPAARGLKEEGYRETWIGFRIARDLEAKAD
jgi:formylglycine-generating enzyme required for sulfatase activity